MKPLSDEQISQAFRQHFAKVAPIGAAARSAKLSPERRTEIARTAAKQRWDNYRRKKAEELK